MAKYLVIIDKNKCINCGSCAMNAPEVFTLSPNGHSIIRKEYRKNPQNELEGIIPEELLEKVKIAANNCMGSAITIKKIV